MVTSPATLAVSQRLDSWDALAIADQAQLNDLTGKNCNARLFRVTQNDTMSFTSLNQWLKDQQLSTWDTMSQDYSWGRNSASAMQQGVEAQGGRVGQSLFAPIGTTDFAANLSQLNGGDGLFVSSNGSDAVNFFKQGLDFGTFTKYKTVVGNTAFSSATLAAVTDPRIVGMWNQNTWSPSVDTPESKAFVEAYTAKTGNPPTDVAGFAYLGMQTLFAGVEKAQSIDPKTVAGALEGLEFSSIKGQVTMRAADHQLEAPVYMGQVERDGDTNRLVEKFAYPASATLPPPDGSCKLS
jgi:branched-chain amino acid transport system substrate-binding protein